MSDRETQSVAPSEISGGHPLGAALLALNNAHARELSWLAPERLEHLVAQAFMARRIGNIDAFLLALDQDAAYDSPNFQWFRARYPRFVYVDRIVVAASARGRGCARRLYNDLFEHARRAGHDRLVCEVNSSPPNRNRTPSMPPWDFSKLAPPASTAAAERCGTCRIRCLRRRSPAAAPAPNRSPARHARREASWRRPGRATAGRSAPAP